MDEIGDGDGDRFLGIVALVEDGLVGAAGLDDEAVMASAGSAANSQEIAVLFESFRHIVIGDNAEGRRRRTPGVTERGVRVDAGLCDRHALNFAEVGVGGHLA